MYRTDKQFMTNPATAGSRIYIGGIPKTVVAADLEEKFKNHGKILGLVLQAGFAFIQFDNETQAQAAIRNESNSMLHGRKIIVKQALDKSKLPNNQQKGRQNQNQNFNHQNQGIPPLLQSQPVHNREPQNPPPLFVREPQKQPPAFNKPINEPPPPQQFQKQEPAKDMRDNRGDNNGPPPAPVGPNVGVNANNLPVSGGAFDDLPQNNEPHPHPLDAAHDRDSKNDSGPPQKRPRKRRVNSKDRDRFGGPALDRYNSRDDSYYGRDEYPVVPPYNRPPVMVDQPDRNDCEIIVVSKALTKYAEYIEQRLKASGLIVDLLFPNEDVPIGRVLANISSRGCLYAILVMPQNEEHRSLTLNVLHGIPQEHRNMPVDDAFVLIGRNFDAYMRGDKSAVESVGPGGVTNISDRHPTSVQLLLNLLAENRQITSVQYDKIVKYLQDRKELQQQHEVAEGVDQASQESDTKQAELQSRIMNILNQTNDNPPPPPVETKQQKEVAPPLLKDPSVQKALDSLLGGDMFKNITGGF